LEAWKGYKTPFTDPITCCLLYVQVWSAMEQNLQVGPPTPGSDREKMFNGYSQQLRDVVQEAVKKRRCGEEQESVPFIDSLLQSGVPDEQVCFILIMHTS